jgi:hypothetical protein
MHIQGYVSRVASRAHMSQQQTDTESRQTAFEASCLRFSLFLGKKADNESQVARSVGKKPEERCFHAQTLRTKSGGRIVNNNL